MGGRAGGSGGGGGLVGGLGGGGEGGGGDGGGNDGGMLGGGEGGGGEGTSENKPSRVTLTRKASVSPLDARYDEPNVALSMNCPVTKASPAELTAMELAMSLPKLLPICNAHSMAPAGLTYMRKASEMSLYVLSNP